MSLRDSCVSDAGSHIVPSTSEWPSQALLPRGLRKPRTVYAPFEYPKAYEYWEKQQMAHWMHSEISLVQDVQDWNTKMTESGKHIVGSTLKGFVQAEVLIGDYWSTKVPAWFPKPEIALMCSAFASMEGIHQTSYAYLGDTLGLDDYHAFLDDPFARAKIDRLVSAPRNASDHEIATSLASFSAFGEGVSLFSAFAILLYFSTKNELKGTGQIISFSIRDESLHSEAGCHFFREFISENPGLYTNRLENDIREVARETVRLEENFIDEVFRYGNIGLTAEVLKSFIRLRTNSKLQEVMAKPIFSVNEGMVTKDMGWFDAIAAGREHADFFATRVTEYGISGGNWDDIW